MTRETPTTLRRSRSVTRRSRFSRSEQEKEKGRLHNRPFNISPPSAKMTLDGKSNKDSLTERPALINPVGLSEDSPASIQTPLEGMGEGTGNESQANHIDTPEVWGRGSGVTRTSHARRAFNRAADANRPYAYGSVVRLPSLSQRGEYAPNLRTGSVVERT